MYTVAIIPSTVGYHWEEVFSAYKVFREASWHINFYTVNGQPPVPEPNSIKNQPMFSFLGMGTRKSFSPESKLGLELTEKLANKVKPVSELNVNPTDVFYIPGGHGCLFDVNTNETVHAKLAEAFTKNKIIGAVCHGTSCLALTKIDGVSIVKGKKIIGFLDSMDAVLIRSGLIDKKFLPLPYWNERTMIEAGAIITPFNKFLATVNPSFTVTDLPFVTGVGPKATTHVAAKMLHLAHDRTA